MEWYWSLSILLLTILVLWGALVLNAKATEVPEPMDEQHTGPEQPPPPEAPAQG
jgi:hypothetical protein